eukprot:scaffold133445_cov67-Phaeocystis_antarctica.AAC.5
MATLVLRRKIVILKGYGRWFEGGLTRFGRWFNQVSDTQQGNHGRAEFRPSHGRDHGEGRDDAVEATEHLRHRAI